MDIRRCGDAKVFADNETGIAIRSLMPKWISQVWRVTGFDATPLVFSRRARE